MNALNNTESKKERIRLYLGYAPGKTTALNGILIRALGANLKVKIILFSKCAENTSESQIYKLFEKNFPKQFSYFFAGISRIRKDGSFRFMGDPDGWLENDQEKLEEGLTILKNDIVCESYDIICIDEITDLIFYNKIPEDIAKNIFNNIPEKTSLIVSGHRCPDWLKNTATTIIEGKIYKHYMGNTKGIEC